MNISQSPATNVLLLYPEESLSGQIFRWAKGDRGRQVQVSRERSLPGIRRLLRQARAALVDATEDPSQATDAFLQAIAGLGVDSVAMYTEVMHDGLEVFVRSQGSLFFLGPLFDDEWASFFECLPSRRTASPSPRCFSGRHARVLPRGFD